MSGRGMGMGGFGRTRMRATPPASRGFARRGRPTAATPAGGIGRLVESFLRRR